MYGLHFEHEPCQHTQIADLLLPMRPSFAALSRSSWKGPYFVAFSNLRAARENNTPIFTQARSCTVLPNFVGIRFHVHNGKHYIPVTITQDMVGHKLGEFAPTRKKFTFRPSKNK